MVTEEFVTAGALALAKRNNASSHEPFMGIARAVLEAAFGSDFAPIQLPTALSLMIEAGVDPEKNGYCRVIDVEKFLCSKLGKEWSATGMSITSLVDELSESSVSEKIAQDGFKIVPEEPTEELIECLTLIIRRCAWGRENVILQWKNLISKAAQKKG